jgi:hypothetical protein
MLQALVAKAIGFLVLVVRSFFPCLNSLIFAVLVPPLLRAPTDPIPPVDSHWCNQVNCSRLLKHNEAAIGAFLERAADFNNYYPGQRVVFFGANHKPVIGVSGRLICIERLNVPQSGVAIKAVIAVRSDFVACLLAIRPLFIRHAH